MRERATVEAALIDEHDVKAVRVSVDRARAQASRGALAAHHNRLDAELREMRDERRAEEGARAQLADDDVAGLRRELVLDLVQGGIRRRALAIGRAHVLRLR